MSRQIAENSNSRENVSLRKDSLITETIFLEGKYIICNVLRLESVFVCMYENIGDINICTGARIYVRQVGY